MEAKWASMHILVTLYFSITTLKGVLMGIPKRDLLRMTVAVLFPPLQTDRQTDGQTDGSAGNMYG